MKTRPVSYSINRGLAAGGCLLLILLLGAGCAGRPDLETGAAVALHPITAVTLSNDGATVQIEADAKLTYTAFKQPDPLRVVLYLPGAYLPHTVALEPEVPHTILQVRADMLPTATPTARVEILLDHDRPYTVSTDDMGLKVHLGATVDQQESAARPASDALIPKPSPGGPTLTAGLTEASRLLDIRLRSHGPGAEVRIVTDGPLRTYNVFTLADPPRIILDLPPITENYEAERTIPFPSEWLSRVRHFGTHDKLRVVLDTTAAGLERYETIPQDDGLLIRVGPNSSGSTIAPPATPDTATVSSAEFMPVAHITDVTLQELERGETVLNIVTSHRPYYDVEAAGEHALLLRLYNARLAAGIALPRPDPDNLLVGIQRAPDPSGGDDVQLLIELEQPTPFRAVARADGVSLHFVANPEPTAARADLAAAPVAPAPAGLGGGVTGPAGALPAAPATDTAPAPAYSGAPISLDFYESDIKNVFRIIGAVSGENIAVDPDVGGRVTLKLDRPVPWDQVLDLVLRMNSLDKVYEGNVIRVARQETIQKEEDARHARLDAERKLREQQLALEPLNTVYIPVNYATAETEVLPHIEKIISERGRASVDTRNNQIILTETVDKIAQARELVVMLDRVTPQVMIEARIVEADSSFARQLGMEWGIARGIQPAATLPAQLRTNPGVAGIDRQVGAGDTYGSNVAVNLPILNPTLEAGFNFTRLAGIPLILNAKLLASESQGDIKIVSSPRVMTMDNKEAVIAQGLRWPVFKDFDQNKIPIYEYENIDLRLTVTPHVTMDERISLKIILTKADIGGIAEITSDGQIRQYFTTKEANTELLVNNGDTIVIGGIHKTRTDFDQAGIPWLSKIPILQWIFKSDVRRQQEEELLIFITPQIVQLEQRTAEAGRFGATL